MESPNSTREHQHRDERGQRVGVVDTDELSGPPTLQDERDDTVSGGDGQQVHDGGLDRDGDAPEGHQQ